MRGIGWMAVVALSLAAPAARAVTLYDGSQNTFPEAQGWLFYAADNAITTKTVGGGKTSFNSADPSSGSPMDTKGGWSNTIPFFNTLVNSSFPTLNSATGFKISFDLKMLNEEHSTNDRAGFDVILLDSNHRGVELGFWTPGIATAGHIWAQTLSGTSFVHGEDAIFDPTAATHYDLQITGGNYELDANGSPILTGSTRDYSSALATPYGLNNYLFVGDDTTSADASVELSSLSIVVPEPACGMVLGVALAMISRRRLRLGGPTG